ncbi:DUF4286 family protein [Pseudomonas bohemica]|uniref:DUF4286 family protein n=1 Tax=Pseudomonas bohemica TaxID=2044872 RepID=UPI000DA5F27F|nr:DUF4286 family protein [Pseudomonas bohemica]
MTHYTFVVLTNPVQGQEHEYNHWYDQQHLPDVLAVPGFISARRFRMVHDPMVSTPLWRYLALYEIDAADPVAVLDEVLLRVGGEAMVMSEALDPKMFAVVYEPV